MSKERKIGLLLLLGDIVLVTAVFMFFIWIKPGSKRFYLPNYYKPFFVFLIIWVIVSAFFRKYRYTIAQTLKDLSFYIIFADVVIVAIAVSLIYYNNLANYSRLIVFGTIIISAGLELLFGYILNSFLKARELRDILIEKEEKNELSTDTDISDLPPLSQNKKELQKQKLRNLIESETNPAVFDFVNKNIDLSKKGLVTISTTTGFNIVGLPEKSYNALINLKRINDIRGINNFFTEVNNKLNIGAVYISCVETYLSRKKRILNKLPLPFNWLHYSLDFLINRVIPKLPYTKQLYFFITKGRNRVFSKAEIFGRLYHRGFAIIDELNVNDKAFFAAKKISIPEIDERPNYGMFILLKRIGKDGKLFKVYKLRTMHPYAEYLQAHVFEKNKLKDGGKFNDDFRITTFGRFLRKFWLDELPMLINLLKGEMKLVGVRPLSKHYFELYTKELQEKRIKYKPGLVPPFYADLPKTLDEIMKSEMKYLNEYEKNHFRTDWKYFRRAVFNIIFKKERSN